MEKLKRQVVGLGVAKSSIIYLGIHRGKDATHRGRKVLFSGVRVRMGKTLWEIWGLGGSQFDLICGPGFCSVLSVSLSFSHPLNNWDSMTVRSLSCFRSVRVISDELYSKGNELTSQVLLAATHSLVHGTFVFTKKTVENNIFLG